jgi:hypothetical protein
MRVPTWYDPLGAGIDGTGRRMGNAVEMASRIRVKHEARGFISHDVFRLISKRTGANR